MKRIMALDYGDRRVGVAVSNPEATMALPVSVVHGNSEDDFITAVTGLIKNYDIGLVVIGMPRHLDGTMGRQAEKVLAFIEAIKQKIEVPVETWDEWLSTVAANRLLYEAGIKDRKKKEKRDQTAAAFILQGYLDSRVNRGLTE